MPFRVFNEPLLKSQRRGEDKLMRVIAIIIIIIIIKIRLRLDRRYRGRGIAALLVLKETQHARPQKLFRRLFSARHDARAERIFGAVFFFFFFSAPSPFR